MDALKEYPPDGLETRFEETTATNEADVKVLESGPDIQEQELGGNLKLFRKLKTWGVESRG